MIENPPWLAAGGEIGHATRDCQSRICGDDRKSGSPSAELDHQSGDNADQSQDPDDDPGDLHPIAGGAFGLHRCSFDPIVPGSLGPCAGTMVVAQVSTELGVRFGWMRRFHDETDGKQMSGNHRVRKAN